MQPPLVDPPPDPVPKRLRMSALVLALYVSAVHLALSDARIKQAHYIGALFVAFALTLSIGAAVAAAGKRFGRPAVWVAWVIAAISVTVMFVGFLLSHTVGLPDYHPHDWPIAQVIALVVELAFLLLFFAAAARLAGRNGSQRR